MYRIGVDIGSTFTKYCVMDGQMEIVELVSEKTPVQQREYFSAKYGQYREKYGEVKIISCGYGKRNIGSACETSELTALAAGVEYACPSAKNVVVDIGGQDTKIIVAESGRLSRFFLNEKCAAGSGMFLNSTLSMLGIGYNDICLDKGKAAMLSSACAVFAQTEIIQLLADGVQPLQIVNGVVGHVLAQARKLVDKVDCREIILTGGFTKITGIREFAEAEFHRPVVVPDNAQYLSAIGCCLH